MTIQDLVEELKGRLGDAKRDVSDSTKIAPNSYGAGYDQGYHDALGELLEVLTLPCGALDDCPYPDCLVDGVCASSLPNGDRG